MGSGRGTLKDRERPGTRACAGPRGNSAQTLGNSGSIWPADLDLWKDRLKSGLGTKSAGFILVPHRLDSAHLPELEKILADVGVACVRTSLHRSGESLRADFERCSEPRAILPAILVDEMGFLSELYSFADWAYVGGGFGSGVHSTIEPAIHGIPISSGPARADQFVEIAELGRSGQLTLVRNEAELKDWVDALEASRRAEPATLINTGDEQKRRWKADASSRLGATQRIAEALGRFCDTF